MCQTFYALLGLSFIWSHFVELFRFNSGWECEFLLDNDVVIFGGHMLVDNLRLPLQSIHLVGIRIHPEDKEDGENDDAREVKESWTNSEAGKAFDTQHLNQSPTRSVDTLQL